MRKDRLVIVKRIDLVDFLIAHGHMPVRMVGNDYWFLAPGRDEKTASFKVDREKNLWFDHGIGKGGTNIDLCIHLWGDTTKHAIERLETYFSFHQSTRSIAPAPSDLPPGQHRMLSDADAGEKRKTVVVWSGGLTAEPLIRYAAGRGVPQVLLQEHCLEVHYELGGRRYYAIGFANNLRGFELRSAHFKGSSSPKASTFLDNGSGQVAVFEGFFSFLSYRFLHHGTNVTASNYLILNSLAFAETNRELMERHERVNLYLDQDEAGVKCTSELTASSPVYKDFSSFYQGQKDLNQWLVHHLENAKALSHARKILAAMERRIPPPRQSRGLGM